MGVQRCTDTIHLLTEPIEKKQWEEQLRYLWRSCFDDPLHYEDFYFCKVYAHNQVYVIDGKGMIHLNYYPCRVFGQEVRLPYIVGVATRKDCRRQGVMRSLLERAISDMQADGIPFTYLMPASEAYYEPFGFCSVSQKNECEMELSGHWEQDIQFVSYQEIKKMPQREKASFFDRIHQWLSERYDVYAIHDEDYFDLLCAEKACQSGDVVFAFEGEMIDFNLCGVFAYAIQEEVPHVEQMVLGKGTKISSDKEWKEVVSVLLSGYFKEYKKATVTISYPYMLRVVDRVAFVEMFGEKRLEHLFTEKGCIYFAEIV